jgi:immunoglobulin-binding protein 1
METQKPQQTLLELFNDALDQWTEIESKACCVEESKVRNCISLFERANLLVQKNSLFSSNETLEDITTSSLTYLTIPYYLSELYQKLPFGQTDRLPVLNTSRQHLEQFLQLCVKYEILSKADIAAIEREVDPDAGTMRNEKIARIRQIKATDELIKKNMKEKIERNSIDDEEDNENERATQILFVQNCALKSIDALRVLKEEQMIMEHMKNLMLSNGGTLPPPVPQESREPLKPIVFEDPRKKIIDGAFLPGWNLPTVSIEQAGEIDHQIALEQQKKSKAREAKEKLVKEFGDSDDDEVELQKKRDWDDWKDDHKKGEGNTGTKGYHY